MYKFIGFVGLIGLVAKYGILITELANQLRDQGEERSRAVHIAAGVRLRPILTTTITTICGAVPLTIATGAEPSAGTSSEWSSSAAWYWARCCRCSSCPLSMRSFQNMSGGGWLLLHQCTTAKTSSKYKRKSRYSQSATSGFLIFLWIF